MFFPTSKSSPNLYGGGSVAVQGAAYPQAGASPPPRRGFSDRNLSGSPYTPGTLGPHGSPLAPNSSPMSFQLPNSLPPPAGLMGPVTPVDGLALFDQDGLPRMGSQSPGGLCPASSLQANRLARPLVLSPGGPLHHKGRGPASHQAPSACDGGAENGCDPTKEEECNAEDCGDEMRGPQDDKGTCGFDVRPLLPVLLVGSTIAGAAAGCALWFPVLREALGRPWSTIIRCFFIVLYTVTCCCMAYCGFCDPGQVPEEHPSVAYYARKEAVRKNPELYADEDEDDEDMNPIPMRAHKAWQYTRPVRRYDHYCRWLANCIGLLNHREFVVMCSGLVILGALGALLDFTVLMSLVHQGEATIGTQVGLVLHLIYSLIMGTRVWPILSLHIGFISRNELANEWKRNDFYVITSARTGKVVPVNDLSDDEHNERFDSFHYAAEKNIFDKGVSANWWSFWCTARWAPDQTGEF